MSQDQPIRPADVPTDGTPEPHDDRTGPAVVEWGGDEPAGRSWAGWAWARSDRRIPPLVAGLGAVALLGSLLSEWRILAVERPDIETVRFAGSVFTFPVVGSVYMVGLLMLAGCAVLAHTAGGPLARHARVVALAACAVLGAVLLAASVHLESLGGTFDEVLRQDLEGQNVTESQGRGLYLAYAGVAAVALAFYLLAPRAGRAEVAEPASQEPHRTPGADPALDDWPWRPEPVRPVAGATDGPVDLTVEPAAPFIPPPDERHAR